MPRDKRWPPKKELKLDESKEVAAASDVADVLAEGNDRPAEPAGDNADTSPAESEGPANDEVYLSAKPSDQPAPPAVGTPMIRSGILRTEGSNSPNLQAPQMPAPAAPKGHDEMRGASTGVVIQRTNY